MEHWEIAETTWLLRSGFMDVRRVDATVTAAPHPDEDEEIELEVVPLSRLLVPGRMPGEGYLDDASSILALSLAVASLTPALSRERAE